MATLARWQRTITDQAGNVLPSASVQVTNEATSTLAPLFSDRAGTVSIGNPFTADANGFAAFHVAGGSYKIDVTSGAFTATWRYSAVGTAAEHDYGANAVGGTGTYSFTANYGPQNDVSQTPLVLVQGSLATPTTNPDAVLIVQKNSAVVGLGSGDSPPHATSNPNPAAYISLTKNTGGADRGVALFAEAQDYSGSSSGFIEGIRAHAVLSGGSNGEAYGVVATASSLSGGYTDLVCLEAQLFNSSGENAPAVFNGTDPIGGSPPGGLSVGVLIENDGANFADAGVLINPYSLGKFRRGYVVGNNSVDQVAFETYATTTVGLGLVNGTQTFAAIAIGNNTPIRMRNQAGNSDFNVMIVGTNNTLTLGTDANCTTTPRTANASSNITNLANGANNNIPVSTSRVRIVASPTPNAAFSVTGFTFLTPGTSIEDGQKLYLFNTTSQQMTIVNQATSSAANQINTLTGGNVVLRTGQSFAAFSYDTTSTKWILESTNGP